MSMTDYAKLHNLNYKTTTNSVWYGKKLYNKNKRRRDPILGRVDQIVDRNAVIDALQHVINNYKPKRTGRPVANRNNKRKMIRKATTLPFHFDTFDTIETAWKEITPRVKDGNDMSLLIKFYNTIVKEANKNNVNV
jgi:hypothetical protein